MKRIFLAFFLLDFFTGNSTIYYSQGSLDPALLSSWGNAMVGGTAPASFTTPGDVFVIQNGHNMTTVTSWTVGGSGCIIRIAGGGTLTGNHTVILSGTFQIDNGGTYIHNNTGPVSQAAGMSIFSGAESFASNSNFEIRNWVNNIVGLPNTSTAILWGNLVINLQADLGTWNWNFPGGQTLTINGNLDIRSTYVSVPAELRITPTGVHTVIVGGNFLLSGSTTRVVMKKRDPSPLDDYTTMQVNGNISLTDAAQLDLGINTTSASAVGLYELRFKGNFSAATGSVITAASATPYLVANGTGVQTLDCRPVMGCSFRVAPGSTVDLASSLTTAGVTKTFAVLGTFNQNNYPMTMEGAVEVAGGIFNVNGPLVTGVGCRACSNIGSYNTASGTWCTANFAKGLINISNSTVTLDNNVSTTYLSAGHLSVNSPGDIYFINSTASTVNPASPFGAGYLLQPGSVLSLDATSYIGGSRSTYLGNGGLLRIASSGGITDAPALSGNVRSENRNYDNSGTNDFEYFGATTQITGDGLPASIAGTLTINNSNGLGATGVTLTQHTTVTGTLNLTQGKLTSTLSSLITIAHGASVVNLVGSFVDGHMKKTGNTNFVFPIGEGNEYAPVGISGGSGSAATDEYIAKYYRGNPRLVFGLPFENTIDHMSVKEWWTIDRAAGTASKNVTLYTRTYTDATLLTELRVLRWNGSIWVNEGNIASIGTPGAGNITSNVVPVFFTPGTPTPFTFGSNTGYNGNPLPVNLISFNARRLGASAALLDWELAACCSSTAIFEVQRAGVEKNFRTISTVRGNETSRFYAHTDSRLPNYLLYYRLKITDADGTVSYSKIIALLNGREELLLTSVVPTIITDKAALTITSSRAQPVALVIVDMQGNALRKYSCMVAAGSSTIQLSLPGFAPGVYHVTGISSAGKTNTIRLIKR